MPFAFEDQLPTVELDIGADLQIAKTSARTIFFIEYRDFWPELCISDIGCFTLTDNSSALEHLVTGYPRFS